MSITEKRIELIREILDDDTISDEEEDILHILLHERVSKNSISDKELELTVGQKAADNLAKFAGSWVFIIIFLVILVLWIIVNTSLLIKPFDSYPFILMNLILSCTAALQAPVIMMSQNRGEEKDRMRAKNDYKVNLKSEIIIEDIHHKLDTILENQQNVFNRLEALEEIENQNNSDI
ncbi:MAG: DUF1003 domain-containing protein [Sedimentibacter sp.]